jgi:cell division transport system permease protein
MIRRLTFITKEGSRALSRSGLAGWLSIFALGALAAFGTAVFVVHQSIDIAREGMLDSFEMEAFLQPGHADKLNSVAEWIEGRDGVREVLKITKDDAARRFSQQYGDDLFNLLEENPLPASVIVRYNPEIIELEWILAEAETIQLHDDIEEIAYEGELLAQLEELSKKFGIWLFIVAGVIATVALFLTFQSVRVAAKGSYAWAEAVRLVGGTDNQVRMPFIFSGTLSGFLGGVSGSGIVVAGQYLLSRGGFTHPPEYLVIVVGTCLTMIIGSLGASAAVPRIGEKRKQAQRSHKLD